jgi:predicted extracellular nuclease
MLPRTLLLAWLALPIARARAAPGDGSVALRIHDLQGRGHLSPYEGATVHAVPGVVTALAPDGFYLQDPEPDDDPATSEGIYVFTASPPTVEVGEAVRVTGRVSEHRPSSGGLTITELLPSAIEGWSSAAIVTPAALGAGGRAVPTEIIDDDTTGSVEAPNETTFDPEHDGIDFYESLEGMWVRLPRARVVGPTNRYGEVWVVVDEAESATGTNAAGGLTRADGDENPERMKLDDALFEGRMPALDVGARLGPISGVVSYAFDAFALLPGAPPASDGARRAPAPTTLEGDASRVTLATYNVENLAPPRGEADEARLARVAEHIASALAGPDVVALQEVQDSSGAEDDGVTGAARTYEALTAAILARGGPRYAFTDVPPADGADGGQPGGNIRVGFLYRPDRVALHPSPGGRGGSDDEARPNAGSLGASLSYNPSRVAPSDPAFRGCRKSLAAQFDFLPTGQSFFVVNDHLGSKLGADPLFGRLQPPADPREAVRAAQAAAIADFVRELRALDPDAPVVVLGDLNDFAGSRALAALEREASLVDLAEAKLPTPERYGYVYEGSAQALDHVLVPRALVDRAELEIIHLNADYADAASDHDPEVLRLALRERPVTHAGRRHRHLGLARLLFLLAWLFGLL